MENFTENDIQVGDIIIPPYPKNESIDVAHRVIETGYDEREWHALTKADNNLIILKLER